MNSVKLEIIDLISEWHTRLRAELETSWNKESEVAMSNTEWHILTKIYSGMHAISDITKSVYITRQATHKHLKNLQAKQLVEIYGDDQNKKKKNVQLTTQGVHLIQRYNELKDSLECTLKKSIGEVAYNELQTILNKEW